MGRERYSPADQARYIAYINSPAWRLRKRRALALAGNRCEYRSPDSFGNVAELRCPRTRYLQVHHLTYARLGHEADEDLQVLCWAHHMLEHLMQARCVRCTSRVFSSDTAAKSWLRDFMVGERFNMDVGPVRWRKVPGKFLIEATRPKMCVECDPVQHGCVGS